LAVFGGCDGHLAIPASRAGSAPVDLARCLAVSNTPPRASAEPSGRRATHRPNLLYDTRHALDEYGALWPEEIKTVVALLLVGDSVNHGRVHAALAPAIDPSRTLPRAESLAVGHGGWEDRGGEVEGFV
jgi:hypothetical protein